MLSTRKIIGALLIGMALMPLRVLAAPECVWPDNKTLEAIVPVATDHGSHASGLVFAHYC